MAASTQGTISYPLLEFSFSFAMLFLLSPAKSLDYDSPLPEGLPHTLPQFSPQSQALIEGLRTVAPQDVASLMSISDKLAALNVGRYAAWSQDFDADNARQALLAFNGDVYTGLQAQTLSVPDLQWAQEHVCILSGLYGVLRPLDWMQPYRLEMGTRLVTDHGSNLYQYWGTRIAEHLNQRQQSSKTPVVINLASQEYFKSVDLQHLKARVIECVFEDFKGGKYKIISFHAKRARGLMARYAIEQRITHPAQLQGFEAEGYAYAQQASSPDRWVFRRTAP
jgi:cytoplasmic iron level regulating protein YaaA (DUF328/UPF0246 family)